jgi:hypothetical protein
MGPWNVSQESGIREPEVGKARGLFLVLACAVLLLSACDAPLNTYEPRSAAEQAVKQVLLDFESGVNERSADRVAGLLHPDASIWIGRERTVLSREEYVRVLPRRLEESPALGLGTPKIDLDENRAEVRVYMTRGEAKILMVFHLVFDKGRWWIKGWEY